MNTTKQYQVWAVSSTGTNFLADYDWENCAEEFVGWQEECDQINKINDRSYQIIDSQLDPIVRLSILALMDEKKELVDSYNQSKEDYDTAMFNLGLFANGHKSSPLADQVWGMLQKEMHDMSYLMDCAANRLWDMLRVETMGMDADDKDDLYNAFWAIIDQEMTQA